MSGNLSETRGMKLCRYNKNIVNIIDDVEL